MIMGYYGFDDMVFGCIAYTTTIDWVLLSVQDFGPGGGIDETPWTSDRVREWTVGLNIIDVTYVHMIRCYDD
jgi:hypothetical protein